MGFLDTETVCAALHTTPAAIYRQRARGQEPATLAIKAGRRLLWRESDLEAWFHREYEKQHTAEVAS